MSYLINQDPILAASFDKIADDYDRYRSGYDEQVIEEIVKYVTTGAIACEVGTGTGLGTKPFIKRGFNITCVEPGAALLERAKKRLTDHKDISFINQKFEDVKLPENHFDLVFSAQAFGWVDESVSYKKAASILKPKGVFAAFYKRSIPQHDSVQTKELYSIIQEYIPDFGLDWDIKAYERNILRDLTLMVECDLFYRSQLIRFYAVKSNIPNPKDSAKSLSTNSFIAALPSEKRDALTEELEAYYTRHKDDLEAGEYETTLMIGIRAIS